MLQFRFDKILQSNGNYAGRTVYYFGFKCDPLEKSEMLSALSTISDNEWVRKQAYFAENSTMENEIFISVLDKWLPGMDPDHDGGTGSLRQRLIDAGLTDVSAA